MKKADAELAKARENEKVARSSQVLQYGYVFSGTEELDKRPNESARETEEGFM